MGFKIFIPNTSFWEICVMSGLMVGLIAKNPILILCLCKNLLSKYDQMIVAYATLFEPNKIIF